MTTTNVPNSQEPANSQESQEPTIQEPVKAKKKKPAANSLGTLAKRQEYAELLRELKNLEEPENIHVKNDFYKRKEGDFPSEMDKLFIALIANMAPKPEEEDTQNLGQGSGMGYQGGGFGSVNVGTPIAPSMGANQGMVENTWNEQNYEDLTISKDKIPVEGLMCIDFLLEKGINPNICTKAGINSMLIACTLNNEEPLLKILNNKYTEQDDNWETVSMKGKFNHDDVLGNDPLAYAVLTGSFYMAEYLMDNMECDINKKYFRMNNQTLLHIVAERFNYKTEANPLSGFMYHFEKNSNENKISFLLEKGSDPSIMDLDGKVPEEYVPFKSEDLAEELGEISEQEEAAWDRCFNKIGTKRKEFEASKKKNVRLSF